MATTYSGWVRDGRPWYNATCIDSFAKYLRGHGFTVYTLGDDSHLEADTPEDHTPYSHTPWPGEQPYPYVLACDIMPDGEWSLSKLGARIYADKQAGVPGTEFIKYINWTDGNGDCWHDSWEPNHQRRSSSDRGHIHLSARTDYVHKATGYQPFAPQQEEDDVNLNDKIYVKGDNTTDNANRDVRDVFKDQAITDGLLRGAFDAKTAGLSQAAPIVKLIGVPAQLAVLQAQMTALAGKDFVDEQAIINGVLGGLTQEKLTAAVKGAGITPESFAAALPPELAQQILDALSARLASAS